LANLFGRLDVSSEHEKEIISLFASRNDIIYPTRDLKPQFKKRIDKKNNCPELSLFSDGYIIPLDLVNINHFPNNGIKWVGLPDFFHVGLEDDKLVFRAFDIKKTFLDYIFNPDNCQISSFNTKYILLEHEFLNNCFKELSKEYNLPVEVQTGAYVTFHMPNKKQSDRIKRMRSSLDGYLKINHNNYDPLEYGFNGLSFKNGKFKGEYKEGFITDYDDFSTYCMKDDMYRLKIRHLKNRIKSNSFYHSLVTAIAGVNIEGNPKNKFIFNPFGITKDHIMQTDEPLLETYKDQILYHTMLSDQEIHKLYPEQIMDLCSELTREYFTDLRKKIARKDNSIKSTEHKIEEILTEIQDYNNKKQNGYVEKELEKRYKKLDEYHYDLEKKQKEYDKEIESYNKSKSEKYCSFSEKNPKEIYKHIETIRKKKIVYYEEEILREEKKLQQRYKDESGLVNIIRRFNKKEDINIVEDSFFPNTHEIFIRLNEVNTYYIFCYNVLRLTNPR
jgi:hypothetical protein